MRSALPRILVVLMVTPALLAIQPARGGDDALRVPTRYIARATHSPRADDATDRLAERRAQPLTLSPTPPPGTGRVPSAARLSYGQLPLGDRLAIFVLGTNGSLDAVVAIDANGNGNLTDPGESVSVRGRTRSSRGRAITTWHLPSHPVAGARLDLTLQQAAEAWNVVMVRDQPTPLEVSDAPPAGVTHAAVAGRVKYASVPVNGGTAPLAFILGEGDRMTILLDRNGNRRLGEAQEQVAVPVADRDANATYWEAPNVPVGTSTAVFALQVVPSQASGGVNTAGARRGTVTVGGKPHHLHVLDADLDGTYGSVGDWWWFGGTERLARVRKLIPDAMIEATEPTFLDSAWRLVSVDAEGHAVLVRASDAGTFEEYLARRTERVNRTRWFPIFEREQQVFRSKHGIDPRRPRAKEANHWLHAVNLDGALEQARRENKPVLVDFEADWCAWCKRYDYYVYPDAEVAALLSRFVTVKINTEFSELESLKPPAVPYLAFFDAQGQPLTFTHTAAPGQPPKQVTGCGAPWQPPAVLAETLRTAYAAWLKHSGR